MLRIIVSLLVIAIILLYVIGNRISNQLDIITEKLQEQLEPQRNTYQMSKSILRFINKEYDKVCEEAYIHNIREQNKSIKRNIKKMEKEISKK